MSSGFSGGSGKSIDEKHGSGEVKKRVMLQSYVSRVTDTLALEQLLLNKVALLAI